MSLTSWRIKGEVETVRKGPDILIIIKTDHGKLDISANGGDKNWHELNKIRVGDVLEVDINTEETSRG